MPETKWWPGIPLMAGLLACGGSEERPDAAVMPDTLVVIDSALAPGGERPSPGRETPAPAPTDTGPWMVDRPTEAAPEPSGWVRGASSGGTAGGIAILNGVRTARHADYDRVVFEFDSRVPAWRVDYVDSPQYECGSGHAVRVPGDGWLQVSFEPANAHTDEGRPTAPRAVEDPAGDNLRELRRICDFEAHVDYVIGVGSPNPYRAFMLAKPARLVIDVRN